MERWGMKKGARSSNSLLTQQFRPSDDRRVERPGVDGQEIWRDFDHRTCLWLNHTHSNTCTYSHTHTQTSCNSPRIHTICGGISFGRLPMVY